MSGGLRVEFEAEAKIRATVDIAAYFLAMDQSAQVAYLKWGDRNWWDGDPAQKPVAYLMAGLDESATVEAGLFAGSGVVKDWSDLEEWDTPRLTSGARWTEDNYAALVAAVPWLAAADRLDELSDEERDLVEARMPHDWDVPLFDLPESA